MNKSFFLAGLTTTLCAAVWAGCATTGVSNSTGTGGHATTSKTTSSSSGTASSTSSASASSTSGTGGSGTGGGGTGGGGGYAILCNPVTNAGCAAGEECDGDVDNSNDLIGFICYPPPNTAKVCDTCDDMNGPYCGGGLTCVGVSATTSVCARFCCSDADCGTGKCTMVDGSNATLFGPIAPSLGVCLAM